MEKRIEEIKNSWEAEGEAGRKQRKNTISK